ncbi:SAF domain-containing protein [Georgenia alba]|uniref:SAF domain-containing protein n=1 Tax=Georgenia alba TaxID=2233858 RepID=A0ABW2Q6P4_9MICO
MLVRSQAPPSSAPPARARRFAWRYRHLLAAVCLAAAVAVALETLRPSPPPSEPVVVVSRDLPAGTVLTQQDLAVRRLPADAYPPSVVRDVTAAAGRPLALGVAAGTAVLPTMLTGPGLGASAPPGTVVVPVPVADEATAQLARPGQRVDLVAAAADATGAPGDATVVARDVVVLAVLEPGGDGGILGDTSGATRHLYVAADERDATVLVGSGAWAPLRAVLPSQ